MRKKNKLLSVLVAVTVLISHLLPAAADASYTEQYLGDGFTRLSLTETAFAANTPREFSVTIEKAGDYTVFFNNANKTATNFTVTFTKDSETQTLCEGSTANPAYAYSYVRIGASTEATSKSVPLSEGTWTLSVTSAAAITVGYIDIRKTTIDIDGSKQAIYLSDYNSTAVGSYNYVNNDMNKSDYQRVAGYTYFADYTDSALGSNTFNYGRGIHLGQSKTVSYKLDAEAAGKYKINLNGRFYLPSSLSSDYTAGVKLAVGENAESTYQHVFESGTASGTKADKQEFVYICELAEGENTLQITSVGASSDIYLYSLTAESYNPAEDNTYVLAKDPVINYMAAAKAAYPADADYSDSIIAGYTGGDPSNKYDSPKPVSLTWDAVAGAESYTLLICETEDFSRDVITIGEIETNSYDVYNLKTDTVYYYKVQAGSAESEVKAFYTADTVRWINVEGMKNVRDLGGWNGLNQGMAYRGSAMDPYESLSSYEGILAITEAGKKVLRDDLGIKTDLDFRSTLTESPLGSDINFVKLPISNYTAAYTSTAQYKAILATFADIDNYPIYFHCSGGADRTGTVAFLLQCLCGADEEDIAIDYELTSFAISFGPRWRNYNKSYFFAETVAKMKEYDGDTLKEKAENYALNTLGLTRAQISNIQSILSGNGAIFSSALDLPVNREINVKLKNLQNHKVTSVTNEGEDIKFSLSGDLLTLTLNTVGSGVITFDDGNTLEFNAAEIADFTESYLGEGFTRLEVREEENVFYEGEARTFDFTLHEDGDYAVFLGKSAEANDFTVTLTDVNGTETKICTAEAESDGYGYSYVRLGAKGGAPSSSLALAAGEYTLSVTPLKESVISYIDIRATSIAADGYAQAFYPADYYSYSDVGSHDYVNGEMNKTEANHERVSGYYYSGDLADSRLAAAYSYERAIKHAKDAAVTYKLNVNKAGTYNLLLYHSFAEESGSVNVQLNNETPQTLSAGESGTQMRCDSIPLTLAAGINTITLSRTESDGYLYHITLEAGKNEADRVVTVDNNLTRIEVDADTNTIAVGNTRGYDFTVPAGGSYVFYTRFSETESYKADVVLKNMTDDTMTTVFSGEIPINSWGTRYKRLGNRATQGAVLESGKEYRLYFSLLDEYGGSEAAENDTAALEFIDVINLSLPVSGKTSIGAHYFSSTTISSTSDMNQSDQAVRSVVVGGGNADKAKPESGYTLIGDFTDSQLAAEKAFENTYFALTPLMAKGTSLSYTLSVEKAGYYTISADIVGNDNAKDYTQILSFAVDGSELGIAKNTAPIENVRNRHMGPSVYLSEGAHTLTLGNKADAAASGTIFLVQILLTPTVQLDAESKTAEITAGFSEPMTGNAIVAFYNGERLSGVKSDISLSEQTGFSAEIPYDEAPDTVKIMLWEDLSALKPLTSVTEITLENKTQ